MLIRRNRVLCQKRLRRPDEEASDCFQLVVHLRCHLEVGSSDAGGFHIPAMRLPFSPRLLMVINPRPNDIACPGKLLNSKRKVAFCDPVARFPEVCFGEQ